MKKQVYTYVIYPVAIIFLILILPLLRSSPEHNLDSMLFVKAMFIDRSGDEYALCVYATDAESGDGYRLFGNGKQIEKAIQSAKKGSYKNLFYSSAELLVLGDGIKAKEFLHLSEYAVKTEGFPLSIATFYGTSEQVSEKYEQVSDAVGARSLGGRVRLWKYVDEALKEGKAPSLLKIREGEDGKIYFEE